MKREESVFVVAQFALLALVFFAPEPFSRFAFPAWLGWLLVLLGVVLMPVSMAALGRNLTALPQPKAGGTLVTTGVFGVVRHPVYSALMLIALGSALLRGSPVSLGFALALVVLLEFKSRREEMFLLERFPAYGAYRLRVKKFVPGVY